MQELIDELTIIERILRFLDSVLSTFLRCCSSLSVATVVPSTSETGKGHTG